MGNEQTRLGDGNRRLLKHAGPLKRDELAKSGQRNFDYKTIIH